MNKSNKEASKTTKTTKTSVVNEKKSTAKSSASSQSNNKALPVNPEANKQEAKELIEQDREATKTEIINDKIANAVKIELKKTNFTPRQLLARNQVWLANASRSSKKTKHKFLQRKLTSKEISKLKQENKVLMRQIKLDNLSIKTSKKKTTSSSWRSFDYKRFELKLQLYVKKQIWKDLWYVALGSLIITIAFDYFVLITGPQGIFPPGVGAIARETSLIKFGNINADIRYFLIYISFNIPFFIFGVMKVGVRFSILSLIGLGFQNIWNLGIISLPLINPDQLRALINYESIHNNTLLNQNNAPVYLIWLFAFAAIGGVIAGCGYGYMYKSGGSTSGIDFISGYFQKRYQISIANVSRIINIGLVVVVLFIHACVITKKDLNNFFNLDPNFINNDQTLWLERIRFFLGPTLYSSFLLIIVQSTITNWFYPKYRFLEMKIFTTKAKHVIEALRYKGITNFVSTWKADYYEVEGFKSISQINLTISMLDYRKVKSIVQVIDPNVEITTTILRKITGQRIRVHKS